MINYKGTPLFGPDSSAQHTSEFFAIAGTILFWILFLIFSFVIKPQPKKPEYKEVQIVLSSTPVVQKTEESPAPAEQAAAPSAAASAQVEEAPVSPIVETPAPKAQPKPTPKKAEPAKPKASEATPVQKSQPVEQVLYQDPMEAFANQTKQQSNKEFDWSTLEDDEEDSSDSEQKHTVQSNVPAFSGSAATATSSASEKVTSTNSNGNTKSQSASSSTSTALEGIKNSVFKGNAVNGVQSESTAKTKTSGSGRVEMEMSNGRSRALIYPEKPIINLSAQAAATIDASITVSISFKVNEKGNVSGVTISPASAFENIVKQEITGQLLEWLFEPADYTANATFEYKIIKQ